MQSSLWPLYDHSSDEDDEEVNFGLALGESSVCSLWKQHSVLAHVRLKTRSAI